MHYVYVICSVGHDFMYVGCTSDLRRRFAEHNAGKELSTKAYIPYMLVYYEAFADKKDAFLRERMLKHKGSSIGHLKKRLANSLLLPKGLGGKSEHSLE